MKVYFTLLESPTRYVLLVTEGESPERVYHSWSKVGLDRATGIANADKEVGEYTRTNPPHSVGYEIQLEKR